MKFLVYLNKTKVIYKMSSYVSVSQREISKADRELTRDVVVSREKYEKAKDAARSWYNKFITLKDENENYKNSLTQFKETVSENEKLKSTVDKLNETVDKLNETVSNLKQNNQKLSHDLEQSQSHSNKGEIEELRKKHKEAEERLKDKIANLEREKILAEGRVQHFDEARKDLYERYNELKSDYRELQKILNKRD